MPRLFLPGDVVGLADLALGRVSLTVRSAEAGAVRWIPRASLLEGVRRSSQLLEGLFVLATQEQQATMRLLRAVTRMSAAERLAFLLYDLRLRLLAIDPGLGANLRLPLSHADLADHLGLTPVYLSRILTILVRRGIVTKTRGGVVIRDEAALEALGGIHGGRFGPREDE